VGQFVSRPRLHDEGFLAHLRTLPCCCGCNRAAPSEAAHIRIGFFAMGKKPDDCNAVPLNAWCHRQAPDSQHTNERSFWERRGVNPYDIAGDLYRQYGGAGGKPKKRRTIIRPRLPKEERQKIRGRTQWPKRPFAKITKKS
jgi:hypothetical protein